ncbi:hypothetical protein [Streptococcus bouchesdurhonensis]|uniref:hypothetical protein n=1 Tax=Streptococcus bouchesdurhonensis TaxID=2954240 RepID=UPI0021C3ADD9|nr:hypothetical protein [Streptococcus bouchesdurhonensis]
MKALTELEKAAEDKINANDEIKDKAAAIKKAKERIGKEDLLKAIENGQIKASDVVKELPTKEDENPVITSKDSSLPEEIKAKIKKAEEADAKRPQSEKLQDKADQLGDEIDSLTKQANKAKAEAEKKQQLW